jgi:hypothetical protein
MGNDSSNLTSFFGLAMRIAKITATILKTSVKEGSS